VFFLERLGKTVQVASCERREVEPHGKRGAVPLGHLEVDASLYCARERRVGTRALADAEPACEILHLELDARRRVVEVRGKTTE
jgi:hypothetical protein